MTLPFPKAILAVDPGGNVGFAQVVGDPAKKSSYRAWITRLGPWPLKGEGEPPKDDALQIVKDFCAAWKPEEAVVICESFVTAQRQNRYGRFTNELIGAVEGICYVYDIPLLMMRNKDRLDHRPRAEAMLGVVHNPNHDRDDVAALSHLLAFIARIQAPQRASSQPRPVVSSIQAPRGRVGTATSKIKRMKPNEPTRI